MLRRTVTLALATIVFGALILPQSAGAYLYWANGGCCVATPSTGTIGRANNDGSRANETFIPRVGTLNLQGLSVSPNDIYWADAGGGTVGHARIDGSNANASFINDSRGTNSVGSDGSYLFWANGNVNAIHRTNLDGTGSSIFISGSSISGITSLAVAGGTVFWVNRGNHSIGESPETTGTPSTLLTVATPAGGITPDLQFMAVSGGYVYWSDAANNTIGRATLASPATTQNDSFITGLSGPEGVAVDATYIYWSNSGQNSTTANKDTIGRAKLDGTGVNQRFITGASVPYGLAIDDRGVTTTSMSCSPASVPTGGSTTCTATVANTNPATPTTPTGTVSFASDSPGSFSATSCTLSSGSCSVTYAPSGIASGTHAITGSYVADAAHSASVGSGSLTVTTRATSSGVSCSPAAGSIGNATTCTATVSDSDTGTSSTPGGIVTFASDSPGTFSGAASCTLSAGTCSVTYTPSAAGSGTHTISGSYSGDAIHAVSQGAGTLTVALRSTLTGVSCSPATDEVGSTTTCTATVSDSDTGTSSTPGGTVTFASDGSGLFPGSTSCTLSSGTCSVTYTPLAAGSGKHLITGSYGGDATHAASQGSQSLVVSSPAIVPPATAAPPTVTIDSPRDGARLREGQTVRARYGCQDSAGAPGIQSCTGTTSNRARIDTGAPGIHTFGVTAISNDGQRTSRTVSYTVIAVVTKPVSARLRLGRIVKQRAQGGRCEVELDRASASAVRVPRCRQATLTFSGTVDRRADGQRLTIVLVGRLDGRTHTVHGQARIALGRYRLAVTLPGRQTDYLAHGHNRGGDPWTYTITLAGSPKVRAARMTGHFTLEVER